MHERRIGLTGVSSMVLIAAIGLIGAAGQAQLPAVQSVPTAVSARLHAIGLDANDPNLGAKLKAHLAQTEAVYVAAHRIRTFSVHPLGLSGPLTTQSAHGATGGQAGPMAVPHPPAGSMANATVTQTKIMMPMSATIMSIYDAQGKNLGSPAEFSSAQAGVYYFLVRTNQPITIPATTIGGPNLTLGCTVAYHTSIGYQYVFPGSNADTGALPKVADGGGYYNYWVKDASYYGFGVGRQRPAQVSVSFAGVTPPAVSILMDPDASSATIDVTIDATPKIASNVYNIGASNATLGSASTQRVGTGNWNTQTSGDDLIGLGIALEPGWKATASILSANSTTTPTDMSPDNTWRGATLTTGPGSDMRTAVHWHYSGIDSLTYTLEWKLTGPLGQRPISTLPTYGSCDS